MLSYSHIRRYQFLECWNNSSYDFYLKRCVLTFDIKYIIIKKLMLQTYFGSQEQGKQAQPSQKFHSLKQELRKYVNAHLGTCVSDAEDSCECSFQTHKENKLSFKISLTATLRNCRFFVSIAINLKEYWNYVSEYGTSNLLSKINGYNAINESIATYQFSDKHKKIQAKIVSHDILTFVSQGCKLLSITLNFLLELVAPFWEKKNAKYKQKQRLIKFIIEALELERIVRSKASKTIHIKNINMETLRQNQYGSYNSQYTSRFKTTVGDYETQLKRKFSRKDRILRCIKQISIKQDKKWKNDDGCNGKVQKYFATYKICQTLSINTLSNVEIIRSNKLFHQQKKQQMKDQYQKSSTSSQQQPTTEQKQVTSFLVKKSPLSEDNHNSFNTQKVLLAIMRGERCYSINSFYCLETIGIENIKYLYSDYHGRKIDHEFKKTKYYLKILLSLCEGIVFLRWNGITHRDLKPDNILLSDDYMAKIIDFGSGYYNKYIKPDALKGLPKCFISGELRTNAKYNLKYSVLPQNLKETFLRQEYEQHCFFDVYPFGILIEELILNDEGKIQLGTQIYELFYLLAQLCQQPNPDDRPDPKDFYVLFGQILKLNQI